MWRYFWAVNTFGAKKANFICITCTLDSYGCSSSFPPTWSHRNGPSQVRRRQKRAEAQRLFDEEATKELLGEEAEVIKYAENADQEKFYQHVTETENVLEIVSDEICLDYDFDYEVIEETEEID